MAAKLWKKIGFFILIVACLFNLVIKIVRKTPFIEELTSSAQYILEHPNKK
ncbi:MAG: hypothetical protein HFJ53_00135 [Clostridia bacterium]|jgi:hypothetical protein|nr:hypothetical protein [Clostridia bacterium]